MLGDLPVLMQTILKFHTTYQDINIILVLPEAHFSFWDELIKKHNFDVKHDVVAGGESRFHSVKNGLDKIQSTDGVVAIHDGVRPLITAEIIKDSFVKAQQHGNAIVAVDTKDSLRMIDKKDNRAVDRSLFKIIQTPQTFRLDVIKPAFELPFTADITDDATVAERHGAKIHMVEGSYANIKITTPEDMVIANALFSLQESKQ